MTTRVDPLIYNTRWLVRSYEIDQNGHVNNAVYLNYAEAVTVEHAEGTDHKRAVPVGVGASERRPARARASRARRSRRFGDGGHPGAPWT